METTTFHRLICWGMYLALILLGILKIVLSKLEVKKYGMLVTGISIGVSIVCVLFLALAREAYAIVLSFLLLIFKGILFFYYMKSC